MKLAQWIDSPFSKVEVPSDKFIVSSVKNTTVGWIISEILPFVFGAAGILLLIYLVTAGLSMMTSRGDPKAMQAAQAKITNALIGFVIVFFAWILVSIIGKVLGLEIFRTIFK